MSARLLYGGTNCGIDTANAMFRIPGKFQWDFAVLREFEDDDVMDIVFCRDIATLLKIALLFAGREARLYLPTQSIEFPYLVYPLQEGEKSIIQLLDELDHKGLIWFDFYGESTRVLFEAVEEE